MIIDVHAIDWSVSQCRPIAQQFAKIVTARPMQRTTPRENIERMVNVNPPREHQSSQLSAKRSLMSVILSKDQTGEVILPATQHGKIHPVMKIAVNGPSLLCRIGPVAFFMKPFDDEKFIAAVRDALNQSLSRK